MKRLLQLLIIGLLFIAAPAYAQENGGQSKADKKKDVESARIKRKKDKLQWKEKREKEKKNRKAIKAHEKKLQTKETRKRMKKNKQKSNRVNQNKREFFLIRLFKPKPRTGAW